MAAGITLRPFTDADLEFGVAQAEREGWAASRAWFEALLAHDLDACFVAQSGNTPVGMVTGTRYASSGWVGNLIVAPEHRRRGLGELLMRGAIDVLERRGPVTLRLDADPPGMGIYRRLGFADEQESLRLTGATTKAVASTVVQPIDADRLPEVMALDRRAFGDDRSRLLALLFPRTLAAVLVSRNDAVVGYALAIPTSSGVSLGPCVATCSEVAEELASACLAACAGRAVTVGCLADNPVAATMYRAFGLVPAASSLRMVRGARLATGRPELVYAIGNGAAG